MLILSQKFYGGKEMAMNDYPLVRTTDEVMHIGEAAAQDDTSDLVAGTYAEYKSVSDYGDAHTILVSDRHFVNDIENEIKDIVNPSIDFAVESEMTDWGTLRLGYKTMYDAGGGANEAGELIGGLGFNYESFNLDMVLTSVSSLVHDPVVYMSGRNEIGRAHV